MPLIREDNLGATYNLNSGLTDSVQATTNPSINFNSNVPNVPSMFNVSSAAIKWPTFSPDSPDLFFLLIEASLRQMGITDPEQVFLSTLMQLPHKVQLNAKHLVNENSTDKMSKLRAIVDGLYSLSSEERLKKLLNSTSLGDMKPTEYLRHIRELQGVECDKNSALIRTYFVQSLPKNIAPLVHLMCDSQDLDGIAAAAEKCVNFCALDSRNGSISNIVENRSLDNKIDYLTEHINALRMDASSKPPIDSLQLDFQNFKSSVNSKFETISAQISTLNSQIQNLTQQFYQFQSNSNRFSRNRQRSRSFNRSPVPNGNSSTQRYYHTKFGDRAHKCIPPCSYTGNSQGN